MPWGYSLASLRAVLTLLFVSPCVRCLRCVGVIEGIVPPFNPEASDSPDEEYKKFMQAIAGSAVFVETDVLIPFVAQLKAASTKK